MSYSRAETNAETGEVVIIQQELYKNAEGEFLLVDVGQQPPDGYTATTDTPVYRNVPDKVTMRQAKEALILAGLDEAAETAINAIQDPVQRKIALCQWRESNEMHRDMPFVQHIGAALGLTEADIDNLFIEAAKR